MNPKPTHGGKRPGSGRKPKPEAEKLKPITLRVPPKTATEFKRKAKRAKLSQPKYFAKIVEESK